MADMMMFPETIEEFIEQHKIVDTEQVYSNGIEYVPVFRMKQWVEYENRLRGEEKHRWKIKAYDNLIKMLDRYNISITFEVDREGEPINYEIQTQSDDWGIHWRNGE